MNIIKSEVPKKAVHAVRAGVRHSWTVLRSKIFQRRILQFMMLAIVAVLGFWLWGLLSSGGFTDKAVEFLQLYSREDRLLAYGFFTLLAMIGVLLGPFTSAPVVPIALLLWGTWTTLGLLVAGWMLGGICAYAIGNFFGYPVVSMVLSRERADAWRELASHRLTFMWALLFRLSMPAETGYIFGMAKYHFLKYLAATFIVELATGAVLVWGGDALVSRDILQFTAWIAGGIIVFAGAAYILRKNLPASLH